jgi:hypothetical protein
MMRRLLDASERIAMAQENHYMGHYFGRRGARQYFRRAGDLRDDAAVRRVVQMLYEGEYARHSRWREVSPFWRWVVREVPRDEVERRLLAAERTERGLFAAFLRLYADMKGKPVMGEKTPTHLGHVDTLLEWFPNGRVIHMQRDPRAIYVSDRDTRPALGLPRRRGQGRARKRARGEGTWDALVRGGHRPGRRRSLADAHPPTGQEDPRHLPWRADAQVRLHRLGRPAAGAGSRHEPRAGDGLRRRGRR